MEKQPMGDVVVLLPGILGSVLQRDGKEVWAPSPGAIGRALWTLGRSVKSLALESDPWESDDLGDGVVATRLMPGIHIVPGLWGIDVYSGISRMITEHFDVVPGDARSSSSRTTGAVTTGSRRGSLQRLADEKLHLQRQMQPRRQADPHRPFDGRPRLALLPRVPRRLAGHAHADHVRDSVPGFDQRRRLPRQWVRQEGRPAEGRRPDDAAAVAHVGVPAAAGLPVRRPRRRLRARRRDR